jgi:Zn-dependent protease/predicted transcriptional regulator
LDSSINLGSIRGIQIGINYTWLIIFALVTGSLAIAFFPVILPGLGVIEYWVLGVIASILLFVSVLLHELSHSFVAQHLGLQVRSITLFVFGGVSNIQGEPQRPRDEAVMAAAGPLASLGIAVVLFGVALLTEGFSLQLTAVLAYLYIVNFLLAIFNLIPGFPLDGGRVFRAVVWGITNDFERSTRIASRAGQVVAYLFIFGGLFIVFTGNIISGLWLAFIGWFLNNAAEQSYRQVRTKATLEGVRVAQMMNANPVVVGPDVDLQHLVDEYVLRRNVRALPVVEEGNLIGVVSLSDVRHVPRQEWTSTVVRNIMTPADQLRTVEPKDDVDKALQELGERDLNQLPVVEGHHLVGLLSRSQIIRFLQLRQELGSGA